MRRAPAKPTSPRSGATWPDTDRSLAGNPRLAPTRAAAGTWRSPRLLSAAHRGRPAIVNAAGIAVFQVDAAALGRKILPLDVEQPRRLTQLAAQTAAKIPWGRRMFDWLVEVFNSTKYPWFKDELV